MKNSNFIKNSILALLPISLGLSVLFGIPSLKADRVEAYTGASLPTTINLNDPTNSTIRSYYSGLNSLSESERKGENLLKNLKTILSNGQKYYNYDSGDLVWKMYEITDRDWEKSPASSTQYGTYDKSTNKITNYVYGSNSSPKNNPYIRAYYMDRSQENVVKAWGNHQQDATGINREHLWAKAEGFDGSGAAGARGDPMHLVAANGYANNIHSNHFYGYVDKTKSYEDVKDKYSTLGHNYSGSSLTFPSASQTVFEPQDCDKGDIARAIFYMAARYNNIAGKTSSQETFDADNPNLLLTDDLSKWKASGYTSTASSPGYHGIVTDLLEWNKIDPPDEYEIHRNNLLYTNFTNNRNPFIDFPNWADICWGNESAYADPASDPLNGEGATATVKSIAITSQPSNTVYTEGESFSTSGMVVTATYSDNTTKTVTDYTYSPNGALVLGTDKIVVSYEGKSADVSIRVQQEDAPVIRYFEKVTSNFTSGSYLITCDDLSVAWKTGASGSNNTIKYVLDDNNHIPYTEELNNAQFTFDLENGTIFAPNKQYIYNDDAKTSTVKNSSTPVSNSISFSDGILMITGSGGRIVKCNKNTQSGIDKPTFNFYAATSSFNSLNVYKLVQKETMVHPESITVNPSTLTLEIGNSRNLTSSVLPIDSTNKGVTWSSSKPSVATIDKNGRVVAVSNGTTVITATSKDEEVNVSGSCTVTVLEELRLDSIEVSGTYKTNYYIGESFDNSGIVVKAYYKRGSTLVDTVDVTSDVEYSNFDTSSEGTCTITATYNDVSTTFDINVAKIPVLENTVSIVTSTYGYENSAPVSSLDKDDFKVTFDKGTGSTAPKYYTYGSSVRAYGGNTITITGPKKIVGVSFVFGDGDDNYDNTISVNKGSCNQNTGHWESTTGEDKLIFTIGGTSGHRRISEIQIQYDPDSTTTKELLSISLGGTAQNIFDVGDDFNYTGLIVTANYNDGTSAVVTPNSVTGADMNVAGEQEITVSYTENGVTKTETYSITVNEVIVLTSISLSGNYKTSFFVGDSFDRTGLIVTAHYSDETTKTVTPTDISGYKMNTVSSSQTVYVSYKEGETEVSTSYTIEVKDIIPASLKVSDIEQTEYIVGDEFNDNLIATVTYNNGSTKVVTPTNIDGYDMSESGEQTVTVEYSDKGVKVNDTYKITIGKKVPENIVISGEFKQNFFTGDEFSYDGLVATVTYNNGDVEEVTPTVSTPDLTTAGKKDVTVSFTSENVTVSDTYEINVTQVVPTKIELSGDYKKSFYAGDTFTSDGLVVTATYNNLTSKKVIGFTVTPPKMTTAGEFDVNVSYTESGETVTASYKIDIIKVVPTQLVLSGNYKTDFNVNDTFTHDGLIATASFNNSSSRVVTPTFSAPDMSTAGEKTITVSYAENGITVTATYKITVHAIVRSVSLDKTNFSVDLHDSIKKILTATVTADLGAEYALSWSVEDETILNIFENGNSVEITPLKVGTTKVTATANDKSATCTITVTSLVSKITLNGPETLEAGKTCEVTASILPSDAVENKVLWSTSNSSILTVQSNGNSATIKAVGHTGQTAKITASAKDGSGVFSSITITIISVAAIRIDYNGINNDNKVPFTKFRSGEDIDAKVIAIWSNGTTSDITDVADTNFKIDCFTLGVQTISASYNGLTVSSDVKVTNEGSENYVGLNAARTIRATTTYNATPEQQAEAWAKYFEELTNVSDLPENQKKAALNAAWSTLNEEYDFMVGASKDEFCDETTENVKIAEAMNDYKSICKSYSLEQFVEDSHQVKPVINTPTEPEKTIPTTLILGVGGGVLAVIIIIIIVVAAKKKHKKSARAE